MPEDGFTQADRDLPSLLAPLERRALGWMATRLPGWVTPDHLTLLGLAALVLAGLSYALAAAWPPALLLVNIWLAANWFGDSLDGTLARVRRSERPRYGFYVDHVVDMLGTFALVGGMALSGYMSPGVAMALLLAYFMVCIEVYLATYCRGTFRMAYWGLGATELRVVLAIGNVAAFLHPYCSPFGVRHLLFDAGGAVAAAGLGVTLGAAILRNTTGLFRLEPLPPPATPGGNVVPERAGARGPGWKRAAAFNLVGCLGAIVQLGCLWMLSGAAGIHYAAAAALSTEVAVLHNFLWHQRWTWRDRPVTGPASLARLWRFNASNGAISLAVALVMMPLLVGGLGLPVLAANLCAIGVASLVNLVVSDTWVFRARLGVVLGVAVGLAAGPVPAHAGPSKAASIAFRQDIERVEVRQAWRAGDSSPFLWVDSHPGRAASVRAGVLAVEPSDGEPPPRIPGGLVHDWTGTVFVPGTDAAGVLALLQDYDRHRIVYGPDVVESQLLARDGNRFHVRLRLSKHMVVTVVLETVHDAAFVQVDGRRWQSRSATTEIREVRGAGTAGERLIAAGDGHGFLWSLRSYWRFEERDGGVYVECRAVSLSRDIPAGLGWLIGPVVRELPRESLVRTLEATRRGMRGAGAAR